MYRLHSEVCKAMGHPSRLAILDLLREGEVTVGALSEALGRSISNTSQHLSVLKSAGLVTCRKEGTTCYYQVSTPAIFKAFDCMGEILFEGSRDQADHRDYLRRHILQNA
jgi:ArsR family transcriptional regulator